LRRNYAKQFVAGLVRVRPASIRRTPRDPRKLSKCFADSEAIIFPASSGKLAAKLHKYSQNEGKTGRIETKALLNLQSFVTLLEVVAHSIQPFHPNDEETLGGAFCECEGRSRLQP
jgi:hypothetical protein